MTNTEPSKKGRRKLNRTIFDIDTAAALRTNAQAAPQVVEAGNPLLSEVTVIQETTGAVHPPDPLPDGPPESAPVEHALDVETLAEEQPHAQIEDVSF